MSRVTRILELLKKKEAAREFSIFLSESSIGGLNNINDPLPVEWDEQDEEELECLLEEDRYKFYAF